MQIDPAHATWMTETPMDASHTDPTPLQALRPADLPAPPQAALEVLRACAAADVDSRRLAGLVSSDPGLSAELLRIANSPYYGLGREVRSAAQAITVLGHKALRNLVLSLSVRDVLRRNAIPDFEIESFWEDVLRCAAAARSLGRAVGADPDECFTVGLLSDFGLLALFHLRPERALQWPQLRTLDPEARRAQESARFGASHDDVAAALARAWALPADLVSVLAHHHDPVTDGDCRSLAAVVHCADWVAAVYQADDTAAVLEQCHTRLAGQLGLTRKEIDTILAQLPDEVTQAAQALGLHLGAQPDFDSILRQANMRLAEENLSYQELAWELQQALRERDRLAAELNRELELAGEIQQSLLPGSAADGLPVYGINLPAGELSGDFYDYFALPDGRVYFNLADVSGKGITAALLMAKTSSLFRCLGKQIHEPARLLEVLNRELWDTSTHGMFVTMVAGVYDPHTDTAELVNAGNPPALLIDRAHKVRQIGAHGPPLGVIDEVEWSQTRFSLDGGSLYLFSDGISEARLGNEEILGIDGLATLLLALAERPPRERLDAVVRELDPGGKRRDDITMLLVERSS